MVSPAGLAACTGNGDAGGIGLSWQGASTTPTINDQLWCQKQIGIPSLSDPGAWGVSVAGTCLDGGEDSVVEAVLDGPVQRQLACAVEAARTLLANPSGMTSSITTPWHACMQDRASEQSALMSRTVLAALAGGLRVRAQHGQHSLRVVLLVAAGTAQQLLDGPVLLLSMN